jgi:hypothetical protein
MLYEHEDVEIDLKKYRKPMISHPFCLTSEEAAVELSDELLKKMKSRIPYKYAHYVEDQQLCGREDLIYEYILYDDRKTANQHIRYNEWGKAEGYFVLVKYNEKYGIFNKIANANMENMRSVKRMLEDNTVSVSIDRQYENVAHVSEKDMLIPTILSYLKNGQSVIYIPNKVKHVSKTIAAISRKIKQSYQLIAKNKNDSDKHSKKGYMLTLDEQSPIYFSAENKILYHLLVMSENLKQVGSHFNSSSTFISRIRCYWL